MSSMFTTSPADAGLETTWYPGGESQMYDGGANDDDTALKSDKDEDIAKAASFIGEDLGLEHKEDRKQEGPKAPQLL